MLYWPVKEAISFRSRKVGTFYHVKQCIANFVITMLLLVKNGRCVFATLAVSAVCGNCFDYRNSEQLTYDIAVYRRSKLDKENSMSFTHNI